MKYCVGGGGGSEFSTKHSRHINQNKRKRSSVNTYDERTKKQKEFERARPIWSLTFGVTRARARTKIHIHLPFMSTRFELSSIVCCRCCCCCWFDVDFDFDDDEEDVVDDDDDDDADDDDDDEVDDEDDEFCFRC